MRVVLVSQYPKERDRPKGGVAAVTVVLARAMARHGGMEVHVVTVDREQPSLAIDKDEGVTVHHLPGSRWPQIADIHWGPGRKRLVQYLLELKPDLVHTHETYGLALGGRLPFPHVFTVHGFDHANVVAEASEMAWLRSRLWRLAEHHGLGRHQHIIAISPYVRHMVEPQTRARIYDIDNPVDERFFNIPRQEGTGRILSVGWINERKNTLGLVQAFARAVRSGMAATLAIAGEPTRSAYSQTVVDCVEREGLRGRVHFLGRISHEQLRDELGRASLFVLASRQENAPMAIAEAMAASVPVVSSNCCGMPYMVDDGVSGYLVDPEDTAALSDRMTRILTDDSLQAKMGEQARRTALNRFHPDVVARKTMDVYQALIRAGG